VEHLQPDQLTDRALVDRILKGDQRAFGIIVHRTERLVVQIVARMVSDVELRKDLAQDVYMKAYQRLSGFRHDAKLSTWIARIAFNCCVDELRKRKLFISWPAVHVGNDDLAGTAGWEPADMSIGAEADHAILSRQRSDVLRRHLEELSPIYRTLVILYHQEELSYDEIVLVTGLPMGTVKNYLFRARKALRESIVKSYKTAEI
jgi:RNA polymerase sigma-70 factor (ECF subfamily)